MKPAIYINPEGIICYLPECPEEPKVCMAFVIKSCLYTACSCEPMQREYEQALAAAKQSAILFEDQEAAENLFPRRLMLGYLKDSIHPFPYGYEVEIVDNTYIHEGSGKYCEDEPVKMKRLLNLPEKYAVLSPVKKEESQEGRLIKLINLYWTFDDNQRHTHNWHDKQDCIEQIKTHFSISRKKEGEVK